MFDCQNGRGMLSRRTVLGRDGITINDVACRHALGPGGDGEQTIVHALVFVRRGCFVRTAEGKRSLLDPTVAYCENPGEEQCYDHPHADGDDCTALIFSPMLAASLQGGEPSFPDKPLPTSPEIDLEHRFLLAAARRRGDPHELVERAIRLAARALEQHDPRSVAAGRPATARARRALVDGAREALVAAPQRSLPELACELAVSPHHLSRIFHSATGQTISRHRIRLRVRAAMERLGSGEQELARLAADLGFADQSHFSRAVKVETRRTPSALRQALA
jgi:AraC-like DNA-binding protein